MPHDDSDINILLASWKSNETLSANMSVWNTTPPRKGKYEPFPGDIHHILTEHLKLRGINKLYTHQAEAWNLVQKGYNVVVSTGTASGKSLCYHLPVVNAYIRDPSVCALYLFPTKALARDQMNFLSDLFQQISGSVPAGLYDGDTPVSQRRSIRHSANLLISNPDMLHMGILPHHTLWERFFRNLAFIIIDEIHYYRGVFGSHIANLLRRLQRVANFYGANPQFLLTSATIANPVDHAQRLIQKPVQLVDNDGSPQGEKHFILYNPPFTDPTLGIRKGAGAESQQLVADLLNHNIQTILFVRSRKSVEFILKNLRTEQYFYSNEIEGYRSGYLAEKRRNIEKGLRERKIGVVVSTNALELGINIGDLDASIIVGFPGSISSTRQQAGRAGRNLKPSIAILVASANPIDQFLIRHPEYLFYRDPESALINPDTPVILYQHIRCACFELALNKQENFGSLDVSLLQDYLNLLLETKELHSSNDMYYWVGDKYPADTVSLRVSSAQPIRLQLHQQDNEHTIGEIDYESSLRTVHPGAIYLQEGETYLVEELRLQDNVAILGKCNLDYYTEPKVNVNIEVINTIKRQQEKGAVRHCGELLVTTQVIGFEKVLWASYQRMDFKELELPPTHLRTMGFWITIDSSTIEQLREMGLWKSDPNNYGAKWDKQKILARERDHFTCQLCGCREAGKAHHVHHKVPFRSFISPDEANRLENLITLCPACHRKVELNVRLRSGLAGLRFLLHNLAPIYLMCDPSDLGAFSDPESELAQGLPCLGIYEMTPAGVGFSEMLFDRYNQLLLFAYDVIATCKCREGCPSCVGPAPENGASGKAETEALLSALVY